MTPVGLSGEKKVSLEWDNNNIILYVRLKSASHYTCVYRVYTCNNTHTHIQYIYNSTRTSVPTAETSTTAHGRPCCAHSALPSTAAYFLPTPRGYCRYNTCIILVYIYIMYSEHPKLCQRPRTTRSPLYWTARSVVVLFLLLLLLHRRLLLLPLSCSTLRQHAFGFFHDLSTPVTTVNRKTDCNYLQQRCNNIIQPNTLLF